MSTCAAWAPLCFAGSERSPNGMGLHHLVAEVLAENHQMLQVLSDTGWPCTRHLDGSVLHVEINLIAVNAELAER